MPDVITSSSIAALERDFVQRVRTLKQGDRLAPVTVIVGANLQHIYLRRRLAEAFGGVANVRFHTLLDLAGEIQLTIGSDDDALALPEGGEALIVRAILEDTAGDGDAIPFPADAVGLPEAIAATLRDLREGMIEADDLRKADIPDRKGEGLATVYVSFKEKLEGFIDRTATLEKAAQASEDALGAVASGAPILVYGIHDLNELQFSMMLRVAATGVDITFFVPWDDGDGALQFGDALVQRLRAAGFEHAVLPSDDAASEAKVTMFSAADRQSEAEEVTRRIVSDLEEGVPPGDIAILHRLDQGYDEVVGGVLDRAGVSFYAASGLPVRRSAVGKAALNLLRLLCDEPRRGPLLEFLSLPCTRLDWVQDGLRPRVRQWESVSKELGLVKGWDEFRSLLQFSLKNAERNPEDGRAAYQKESAETLLPVVEALATEAGKADEMVGWAALGDWFTALLDRSVKRDPEGNALEAIVDRVQRLAVLDSAGVSCDRASFAIAAESAIRGATVSGGYFQRDGLFLGNVVSARGLRFRRVYVLECAERVFPPVIRQDPLLLDGEREAVNKVASGSLPLKHRRLDEERMLFELARQSAVEQLTVSYSRRTSLTGSPRLPSSLLLDLAARRSGSFQSIEEIERAHYDWFARIPSRVGFEASTPDDAFRALDASDLRFHALELAGRNGLSAVAPLWPDLDRLSLLQESRGERQFGPFDGIVPPELVEAAGVLERNLSASSLGAYAECPYRFFLGKVLGLSAQTEPEETLEIGAAPRGTFIHHILERFVDGFLEGGDGDWEAYLRGGAAKLEEIVESEVKELATGITGLPVSWQIVREEIEDDLREYLKDEIEHAGEGWRPIATEMHFEDVPLEGDGKIKVRGAIDRLDRRDSGGVRVVDYKTGRVWEKGDGYRKGRSLQLPIYLKAACHELDAPLEDSRGEYHYSTRKGGFSRPGLDGRDLLADGRFGEVVDSMAEGIASGAFFYWPLAQRRNCRLCDFYDVCQTRVEPLANRKAPGSSNLRKPFERISQDRATR